MGESSGDNTNCSLNFKPKMDETRLIEGYQTIMRTIYKPSEYYRRALDSLSRTGSQNSEQTNFSVISGLAAFGRVVLKLGLLDSERLSFWRFFADTLREHRTQLADSMRLAAMGYHFRKLNESYGK